MLKQTYLLCACLCFLWETNNTYSQTNVNEIVNAYCPINSIVGNNTNIDNFSYTSHNTKQDGMLFIDAQIQNPNQIFKAYSEYHCDGFHLFTHGKSGQLLIDGDWKNAQQIAKWLQCHYDLRPQSKLNIYGCEFAKGEKGEEAVAYLENILDVSVSASNDVTGTDGDWELEIGQTNNSIIIHNYQDNLQQASLPIQSGMATVTCFSALSGPDNLVGGVGSDPSGYVMGIYDIREPDCGTDTPGGSSNWQAASDGVYHDPSWTAANLGELFGLDLCDNAANPDMYVTSDGFTFSALSNLVLSNAAGATGGDIFKIDGTTGAITHLVGLPNTQYTTSDGVNTYNRYVGLGNVSYNCNSTLYVTNLDDGKIYAINESTGTIIDDFDHGLLVNGVGDDTGRRYTQLDRLVYGVAYNPCNNRVYYGVPGNVSNNTGPPGTNLVYSVGLNPDGTFDESSIMLEITINEVYTYNDGLVTAYSVISDIEFNSDCSKMIISQRSIKYSAQSDFLLGVHAAGVFNYSFDGSSWVSPITYTLGTFNVSRNGAGGVDFGYGNYGACGPENACEDAMVASVENFNGIFAQSIYGMQISDINGNGAGFPDNSYYVDLDGTLDDLANDKTGLGDVDVYSFECRPPCDAPTPAISVTDNVCDPVTTGSFNIVTDCGTGYTLEYSTDGGATWSTTAPTYGTSAINVMARCINDADPTCVSPPFGPVTSNPAECCTPPILICESNINNQGWVDETDCAVTVCEGDELSLSVNPNGLASYTWTGPNGFSGQGDGGGAILISSSINSSMAGVYTVITNVGSGCSSTASITVSLQDCGTGNGDPQCVCEDYLYLNDPFGSQVHKYQINANGTLSEILNNGNTWYPGGGISELSSPHGLGADLNGFLYIGDAVFGEPNKQIRQLTCDGTITPTSEVSFPIGAGVFNIVSTDNSLFYTVLGEQTVKQLDICSGTVINEVCFNGNTFADWGLFLDDNGTFYAATSYETTNANLYRFTINDFGTGVCIDPLISAGDNIINIGDNELPQTTLFGVTTDDFGNIYIVDKLPGQARILKYDSNGNLLATSPYDSVDGDGGWFNTTGLVYSETSGLLYSSSESPNEDCVYIFDTNLNPIGSAVGPSADGGNNAKGIAIQKECCPIPSTQTINEVFCTGSSNTPLFLNELFPCEGTICEGIWNPVDAASAAVYDDCAQRILPGISPGCYSFNKGSDGTGNKQCGVFNLTFNLEVIEMPSIAVSGNQLVCGDDLPQELSVTISDPSSQVQWQMSTTSCTEGFSDVVGANSTTYQPNSITQTTYFKAIITNIASCSGGTCQYESDCITVNYFESPPPEELCEGETINLFADSGFTSYQWFKDGVVLMGETAQTITVSEAGFYQYTVDGVLLEACNQEMCCPIEVQINDCFDVALTKSVDLTMPSLGSPVVFTIVVENLGNAVTGATINDILPSGLTYNNIYTASTGSYDGTNWIIGDMGVGQIDSIQITVTADAAGVITNEASVSINELESNLNNNEDNACVSVPIQICDNQSIDIDVMAEAGFTDYQWFKDGIPISGATNQSYKITEVGIYTYTIDGTEPTGDCEAELCCPIVVEQVSCCPTLNCLPVTVTITKTN